MLNLIENRQTMTQRKKLNKINEPDYHRETKSAKIAFDGKQFLVRIPTEISGIKKMKKGDKLEFIVEIPPAPEPIENAKLTITYVRENG